MLKNKSIYNLINYYLIYCSIHIFQKLYTNNLIQASAQQLKLQSIQSFQINSIIMQISRNRITKLRRLRSIAQEKSIKKSNCQREIHQHNPKFRYSMENKQKYDGSINQGSKPCRYTNFEDYQAEQSFHVQLGPKRFTVDKTIQALNSWSEDCESKISEILNEQPPKLTKMTKFNLLKRLESQIPSEIFCENCQSDSYIYSTNKLDLDKISEQFRRLLIENKLQAAQILWEKMTKQQKNQKDSKGYTNLHLAVLCAIISKTKAHDQLVKKIMFHPECNINTKNNIGWSPLQDALYFRNLTISTQLFKASYLKKRNNMQMHLNDLKIQLAEIKKDFSMEIQVNISSYLPFVSNFTPSDTIKIYKLGSSLRIDYTLVGYQTLICKRRNISILFNPPNSKNNDNSPIFIINHSKKIYTNFFQQLSREEIVLMIKDLLTNQMKKIQPIIQDCKIKPDTNIFGTQIVESYHGITLSKYNLNLKYTSTTQKRQPASISSKQIKELELCFLESYENYKDYQPIQSIKEKNKNKKLSLGLWICNQKDYQLQFGKVLKILKTLGISNRIIGMASQFIQQHVFPHLNKKFPIKIELPLDFSFCLQIKFKPIKPLNLDKIFFQIPKKYTQIPRNVYQNTLNENELKNRMMLTNLYT